MKEEINTFNTINNIDYVLIGETISDLSFLSVGIIVTVFVLSVTLLGRAAKLEKEKKAETEQKSKQQFEHEIAILKEKLESSPEDIAGLQKQLDNLITKKQYSISQLNELEKKYKALGLKKSVLIPGLYFVLSIFFGKLFLHISTNTYWQLASFILSSALFFLGIKRIYSTLSSVAEVAVNSDDYQVIQLQNTLTEAFKTAEAEKEPKPIIKFQEQSPFVFAPNTEVSVKFIVDLLMPGNKEAKNLDIWFLSSPEIVFIKTNDSEEPFKQNADYLIPHANTIRYKIGMVRKFTNTSRTLKIKTGPPGTYKIKYKVDCDDHIEPVTAEKEIGVVVQ